MERKPGENQRDLILEPLTELKLGELLLHRKVISNGQLLRALAEQKQLNAQSKRQFKIGEVLLFNKAIDVAALQENLLAQRPRNAEAREHLRALKTEAPWEEDPWAKAERVHKVGKAGPTGKFKKFFGVC